MPRFEALMDFGPNPDNDIRFVGRMQNVAANAMKGLLERSKMNYYSSGGILSEDNAILLVVAAGYSVLDFKMLDKINDSLEGGIEFKFKWFVLSDDDMKGYESLRGIFPQAAQLSSICVPWLIEFRFGAPAGCVFGWQVYSAVDRYISDDIGGSKEPEKMTGGTE